MIEQVHTILHLLVLDIFAIFDKHFHEHPKVFKNGPSEICGRQPLKNFTWPILEYVVPYYWRNTLGDKIFTKKISTLRF